MRKIFSAFILGLFLTAAAFVAHAGAPNMYKKVSDFDGDGRADFAVTRDESDGKYWYVWQTTAGFKVFRWGLTTDIPTAGDYDGDGKTDFAVFRDSTSFPIQYSYHFLESSTGNYVKKVFTAFANFGSYRVHQDYNGDGKVDAAINIGEFTSATQLVIQYSGGGGAGGTVPAQNLTARMGDLDGDGRADLTHYNWQNFLLTSTNLNTNMSRTFQFGGSADRLLMADFDGDGIGDLTIFRPSTGTWWWVRSSDGQPRAAKWGSDGDTPVPADYDGDGKTDLAIWRPGTQSAFWVVGSQSGAFVFRWGSSLHAAVTY